MPHYSPHLVGVGVGVGVGIRVGLGLGLGLGFGLRSGSGLGIGFGLGLAHVRLKRPSDTERFRLENQPFSGALAGRSASGVTSRCDRKAD